MDNPAISAVIITHNEEENISKCLASLTGLDEIIVVDSGSDDATIEIAKNHGAKLIKPLVVIISISLSIKLIIE